MSNIAESIKITIEGNEFTIHCPTIGQIIDIESNKLLFSNNMYPSLLRSKINSSIVAVDLIEAISSFMVLIPDMKTKINLDSVFELNIIKSKEIVQEYRNVFIPWYSSIIDLMKNEEEVVKK